MKYDFSNKYALQMDYCASQTTKAEVMACNDELKIYLKDHTLDGLYFGLFMLFIFLVGYLVGSNFNN